MDGIRSIKIDFKMAKQQQKLKIYKKKEGVLSRAYNGNVPVTNTTAKTSEIVDSNLTNT